MIKCRIVDDSQRYYASERSQSQKIIYINGPSVTFWKQLDYRDGEQISDGWWLGVGEGLDDQRGNLAFFCFLYVSVHLFSSLISSF